MSDRAEEMEGYGETSCPDWCEQPDDEADQQQHISELQEYRTGDGDLIQVRARLGWGGDSSADQIQIAFVATDGSNELWMTLDDKSQLDELLDTAEDLLTSDYTTKEAYPGAWDDEDEEEDDEDDGEED